MNVLSMGRVSSLGVMLASVGVCHAVRETIAVVEGGITFTVVRYDDGRTNPYRLKFSQGDTRSLYTVNAASQVTNIKVGLETYKMLYDTSDNLVGVELTTESARRALAEEENDAAAIEGRRLEFDDCVACEETRDALCTAVPFVCYLVDHGSPFSTTAAASVKATCETFGSGCSKYEASEACQDQCTADEETYTSSAAHGAISDFPQRSTSVEGSSDFDTSAEEEETTPVVSYSSNSCLDPTSDGYKCTFSGDTTMDFDSCRLTDAEVVFLPACFEEFGKTNIERLLLDRNVMTSIAAGTFAGLSEMTFLDLDSNNLVTVPKGLFGNLTKLENLDLSWNDLASLPEGAFSDLASLQVLDLSFSELTTVSEGLFNGLKKLEHLDLAWNDLVGLPEGAFSDLASLQTLSLSHNELTPKGLPVGLFSGVPLLQELDLGTNDLGDMSSLVGLFDGLAELVELDLGESGVRTVPEGLFVGLTKLQILSMDVNELKSLPDGVFSGLTALRTLDLADNDLASLGLSLSGLTELRSLYIDYNDLELTEDVFSDLVNLETLLLREGGVTTLPAGVFSPLVNLVEIDLAYNRLVDLGSSLSGLTDLRTLDLTHARLTELGTSLSGLMELRTLYLDYNDLELAEDALADLVKMEALFLRGCDLTTLPAGIFSPLAKLQRLEIGHNEDLQCLPSSTVTDVELDFEAIRDGTCECTPKKAVFCGEGLTCQIGIAGYTCVAA